MAGIVKIVSTGVDKLKRLNIKALVFGSITNGQGDTREITTSAPYGVDSNPVADIRAIYTNTTVKGRYYIIGCINEGSLAQPGECRIFSTDAAGALQSYAWLRNEGGVMELNGNDNFAVKFNELKIEFNKLKTNYNDLVTKFNTHTHPYVNVATPATTSPTATPGTANTSNIDNAKNDKIKTN